MQPPDNWLAVLKLSTCKDETNSFYLFFAFFNVNLGWKSVERRRRWCGGDTPPVLEGEEVVGVDPGKQRKECGGKCLCGAPTVLLIHLAETRAPCLCTHRTGREAGEGRVTGTVWTCLWKYTHGTHIFFSTHSFAFLCACIPLTQ